MVEILKNIVTSEMFLTVIAGVLVFIISQLIIDFIVNPHKVYRSLKERIAYTMAMYTCFYHSPYKLAEDSNVRDREEYIEASKETRKIGSELAGYLGNVPRIRFNKRKKLEEVKNALISLSNGLFDYPNYSQFKDNIECENIIKKSLKIKW